MSKCQFEGATPEKLARALVKPRSDVPEKPSHAPDNGETPPQIDSDSSDSGEESKGD